MLTVTTVSRVIALSYASTCMSNAEKDLIPPGHTCAVSCVLLMTASMSFYAAGYSHNGTLAVIARDTRTDSMGPRSLSQDLIFLPIRDASGTTQLVYRAGSATDPALKASLQRLTNESVICAEGVVRTRPDGMRNPQQATGDIEVELTSVYCLNPASHLPFWPSQSAAKLVCPA